ncbi:MAG: NADP-dependent oxidoreductase [Verrucomicrobiaceae bacterium]|nr:NADP-dependent oxidoreductase [Verrucomicrobiaceae bacterium]
MRAIHIHKFGSPQVLSLEEVSVPTPDDNQVLVEVHAASVNPVDGKIRSGSFKRFRPHLPATLGRDFSGVIVKLGAAVKGWKEGDEVFGMQDYSRGTYAENSLALPSEMARKPAGIDHAHAACLGVAGLTAWQALYRYGGLESGQRVVILGAGGGVGQFAVQFAAIHGAEVIAVASQEDMEVVKDLGAAMVINYKTEAFEKLVTEVDLVLDLVGKGTWDASWKVLKTGGILVSTLGLPVPPEEAPADVRGAEVIVECNVEELTQIAALVSSGRVVVNVDTIVPLTEASLAHEHIENGHSRAKTVLIMRASARTNPT